MRVELITIALQAQLAPTEHDGPLRQLLYQIVKDQVEIRGLEPRMFTMPL